MASALTPVVRNRIIGAVVLVILIVAMVLNTKFLTPEELAATRPKEFSPPEVAAELFTKAQAELPGKAVAVGDVVKAVQTNVKDAASTYEAVSPAENAYVFTVKATGTVTAATDASVQLQVSGVPGQTRLIVPLSTAVNGTVLRDAMGFKFADAPGQTDYQYVGDELKKLIQSKVVQPLGDPTSLEGKTVDVVGVISVQDTGTPVPAAKPINIQPVTVTAS